MEDGDSIEVFEEQVGGTRLETIVRDGGGRGHELKFTLKPTTKLGKMMDAYCTKQNYFSGNPPRRIACFFFDGTQIQNNDSAELVSKLISQ
jgi:hypothetical protein